MYYMPKINIKKYGFVKQDELIRCPHCRRSHIYFVEFHFEDRPRKKEGRIVIPLELLKTKVYDVPPPVLCMNCELFPKCTDCEIILCGWRRHTHSHPHNKCKNLCEACFEWMMEVIPI